MACRPAPPLLKRVGPPGASERAGAPDHRERTMTPREDQGAPDRTGHRGIWDGRSKMEKDLVQKIFNEQDPVVPDKNFNDHEKEKEKGKVQKEGAADTIREHKAGAGSCIPRDASIHEASGAGLALQVLAPLDLEQHRAAAQREGMVINDYLRQQLHCAYNNMPVAASDINYGLMPCSVRALRPSAARWPATDVTSNVGWE